MNLSNKRPNQFLHWCGMTLLFVGLYLAVWPSENMPYVVKQWWGVGYTRILGASRPQLNDGAVSGQILRGRQVNLRDKERQSELQLKAIPTREEMGWVGARVDGRAIWRTFWLVVSGIGLLMIIFGLGTDETRNGRQLSDTDSSSGGGATQPSSPDSTSQRTPLSAEVSPIQQVPTAFAPMQAPAQPGRQDRVESVTREEVTPEKEMASETTITVENNTAELFMRWTDKGSTGEQSSHELTIGGAKLNEASSLQVFFDLKQGMLLSAKPTVSFERDNK